VAGFAVGFVATVAGGLSSLGPPIDIILIHCPPTRRNRRTIYSNGRPYRAYVASIPCRSASCICPRGLPNGFRDFPQDRHDLPCSWSGSSSREPQSHLSLRCLISAVRSTPVGSASGGGRGAVLFQRARHHSRMSSHHTCNPFSGRSSGSPRAPVLPSVATDAEE